ncbi:unnamed protein product [Discula destructiva]
MAAMTVTGSTIAEQTDEESASTVDTIEKKLNKLAIKKPKKRKPSLPANNLFIQPTPHMITQSPVFSPHILAAPPNNERSYLLENRQRQHERGQRLSDALHILEVRLSTAQSKAEGRKLRKEAGLLEKKITESLKQEQLITLRLNDIQNEDLSRNPYWQAQTAGLIPYQAPWSPYSPMTPWSPMTLPMMSPMMPPVSPLTPLPPGLYHPSPMMPSPLNSPFWLGAQYQYQYQYQDQTMAPYIQNDPGYYPGTDLQQAYALEDIVTSQPLRRQSMAPTVAELREAKHKGTRSVDFKLPQEGAYTGRRWSLADTFSPTPKDKRMSMPGLETIWKDGREKKA